MSRSDGPRAAVPGLRVLARGKSWSYRLELPPDPLTSKRRFEWKGGHASEAAAWEAGIVARADEGRGQRVQPARRTVETYLTEWLNSIEASVKPGTHTNYSDYTAAYVIPHIGTKKLQDLDVPTLNELYRRLLVEGRRKPDNNARMYAHWVQHQDIKPAQLAEACGTSIHAARHAVLRYRRGRLPVVHGNGLEVKTVLKCTGCCTAHFPMRSPGGTSRTTRPSTPRSRASNAAPARPVPPGP